MKKVLLFSALCGLLIAPPMLSSVQAQQCPTNVSVTQVNCGYNKKKFKIVYRNASLQNQGLEISCDCYSDCIKLKPTTTDTTIYTDCFSSCGSNFTVKTYSHYYGGSCHNFCGTLPLNFISFDVLKENTNKVKLLWKVEMQNLGTNAKFEVQRSYNGTDFSTIAVVLPDQVIATYNFPDEPNVTNGRVFYRILFVENGKEKYSPDRMVSFKTVKEIKTFINGSRLFFEGIPNGKVSATLVDVMGRIVLKETSSSLGTHGLQISNLPKGVYVVSLIGDTEFFTGKFAKWE